MPAYIPPALRRKLAGQAQPQRTRRTREKKLRFPSNATAENSLDVSFAPVSKLFSNTASSIYKVFSSSFATRKVRKTPLKKVLKTGARTTLRPASASPMKKKTMKKRPASI
jgi:hypothetical protein